MRYSFFLVSALVSSVVKGAICASMCATLTLGADTALPSIPTSLAMTITNNTNLQRVVLNQFALHVATESSEFYAAIDREGTTVLTMESSASKRTADGRFVIAPHSTVTLVAPLTSTLSWPAWFRDARMAAPDKYRLRIDYTTVESDGRLTPHETPEAVLEVVEPTGADAEALAILRKFNGGTWTAEQWANVGDEAAAILEQRVPSSFYSLASSALIMGGDREIRTARIRLSAERLAGTPVADALLIGLAKSEIARARNDIERENARALQRINGARDELESIAKRSGDPAAREMAALALREAPTADQVHAGARMR